eukprot:CAMPEP_0177639786 /NCGR_PEP_ID=MMETSP0447-20121125/6204_1 /TAXON_ID=0 /ORGANISM="Stygamoeba regulata, Strain BSH-02190019" /LENGTH=765 /DNA_ID=CAMNT_0019141831 /DNA_START=107 /DNA_END=2404 /DNA_ORIENTATION=+
MGNSLHSESKAKRDCSLYVDRVHPKSEKKSELIDLGYQDLCRLRNSILSLYPYLKDAEESACLVDLRVADQPLIFVNDEFLRLTLYPREEIIGRNCRFLQGKFTNRRTVGDVRRAILTGTPLDVEILNYRKDGLPFWNNFLLLPVWEDVSLMNNQPPTHFIAIQKDVTFLRPHIKEPYEWSPEDVAIFFETMRCPTFAASCFHAHLAGPEVLDMKISTLDLFLPEEEAGVVGDLITKMNTCNFNITAALAEARYSHGVSRSLSLTQSSNVLALGEKTLCNPKLTGRLTGVSTTRSVNAFDPPNKEIWESAQGLFRSGMTTIKLELCHKIGHNPVYRIILLPRVFFLNDLESAVKGEIGEKNTFSLMVRYMDDAIGKEVISAIANTDTSLPLSSIAERLFKDQEYVFVVVLSKRVHHRMIRDAKKPRTKISGSMSQAVKSEFDGQNSPMKLSESDLPPTDDDEPEDRLTSQIEREEIMQLISNPTAAVSLISHVDLENRPECVEAIMSWYKLHDETNRLVRHCISSSIAECKEQNMLFREDSPQNAVIKSWVLDQLIPYLNKALVPTMESVQQEEVVTINHCRGIICSLIRHANVVPPGVRSMFAYLSRLNARKFPERRHTGIINFIFLRIVCPAIIFPTKHGIKIGLLGTPKPVPRKLDMTGSGNLGSSSDASSLNVQLASRLQQVVSASMSAQPVERPLAAELSVLFSRLCVISDSHASIERDRIVRSIQEVTTTHMLAKLRAIAEKVSKEGTDMEIDLSEDAF